MDFLAARLRQDFGARPLDIVVHSLANAPEVKKPLLDTSRRGYLEAVGVSAYSNVALVRHLGPMMQPEGAFLSLTYMAGERVIPGIVTPITVYRVRRVFDLDDIPLSLTE